MFIAIFVFLFQMGLMFGLQWQEITAIFDIKKWILFMWT